MTTPDPAFPKCTELRNSVSTYLDDSTMEGCRTEENKTRGDVIGQDWTREVPQTSAYKAVNTKLTAVKESDDCENKFKHGSTTLETPKHAKTNETPYRVRIYGYHMQPIGRERIQEAT